MKGKTRPELFILFERGYTIKQLKKHFPESSVYAYHVRWLKARQKANDLMVVK